MRGATAGKAMCDSEGGTDVLDALYGSRDEAGRQLLQQPSSRNLNRLGAADERLVLQEMMNFVNNLHQAILDRLLLNAWVQLERVSGPMNAWVQLERVNGPMNAWVQLERVSGPMGNNLLIIQSNILSVPFA
jgi:hypothetical protein